MGIEQNNVNQNEAPQMNFLGRRHYRLHSKYSTYNIIRVIKNLLLSELLTFINKKISELYNNEIGYGINKKELMRINWNYYGMGFNKEFLNKTIGEIFSVDISAKIKAFLPTHNKNLIKELKEEEDPVKNEYFNGLFDTTFLECLEYFRGDIVNNQYIEGLKKFSELEKIKEFKEKKEDEDYYDYLKEYLKCYEYILNRMKPRKRKIN